MTSFLDIYVLCIIFLLCFLCVCWLYLWLCCHSFGAISGDIFSIFSLWRFGSGNVFLVIPLALHFHQFLAQLDLGNFFPMIYIK